MTSTLLPEWHRQDGVQLTWPTPQSDWAPLLDRIEATLEAMVVAITRHERVLIAAGDEVTAGALRTRFAHLGIDDKQLIIAVSPSDDTWARDHGPLAVERDSRITLLDYRFTGWGGKFAAERDNALTLALRDQNIFSCDVETHDIVLEGGALESDGQGTLLTTEACLLNENRNPHLSREQIEAHLRETMGIKRVLWLSHGHLEGDDTDSHVDTLARFCNERTIAYVRCNDPQDPHYSDLKAMEAELQALRQSDGTPYTLVPLPWPRACFDPEDGHRLPATYANFLIINDAVLLPTYADPADIEALKALESAFPDRTIIPIDCRSVIRQHGSLHCLTMQLPCGTLA